MQWGIQNAVGDWLSIDQATGQPVMTAELLRARRFDHQAGAAAAAAELSADRWTLTTNAAEIMSQEMHQ